MICILFEQLPITKMNLGYIWRVNFERMFDQRYLSYVCHCLLVTFPKFDCLLIQIEDGEIFATINQKDGMVSFHDNPEKYNNVAMLIHLDQEVGLFVFPKFYNLF